ncbi:hypothetical protein C6Y10_05280 [Lactiplantibacillus pentosus]|uniref:DUF6985 domain-containing protein n=1 Tax=Lactiplantibacillus pentosus TaxID=1589 RepID=UPI000D01634A|nr:hypothetical protein [Lactiplantibacillus pentosus]PRO85324.1 hypothetical protein C6Y10_05280 [Lactiplantibacillus pentosus]
MISFETLKAQVEFNQGWILSTDFKLVDNSQTVTLTFEAASKDEPISEIQYATYQWFVTHKDGLGDECLSVIKAYLKSISNDVVPYLSGNQSIDRPEQMIRLSQIVVKGDGQLALLFEEDWDENGIAVIRQVDGQIKAGPTLMLWN